MNELKDVPTYRPARGCNASIDRPTVRRSDGHSSVRRLLASDRRKPAGRTRSRLAGTFVTYVRTTDGSMRARARAAGARDGTNERMHRSDGRIPSAGRSFVGSRVCSLIRIRTYRSTDRRLIFGRTTDVFARVIRSHATNERTTEASSLAVRHHRRSVHSGRSVGCPRASVSGRSSSDGRSFLTHRTVRPFMRRLRKLVCIFPAAPVTFAPARIFS